MTVGKTVTGAPRLYNNHSNQFHAKEYFEIRDYMHQELFLETVYVWEAFSKSEKYLEKLFKQIPKSRWREGTVSDQAVIKGDVIIAEGAKVEPTAYIEGPAYIGPDSIIGTAAYIRGNTILGRRCIIGHCTEAKNTIMLDGACAPHFNFIGDSIMGRDSNIGAGVILANFRLDKKTVPATKKLSTKLTKFGAVLGDRVKVACNAVLEPGTFIRPDAWIGPVAYIRRGIYEKGERHSDLVKVEKKMPTIG